MCDNIYKLLNENLSQLHFLKFWYFLKNITDTICEYIILKLRKMVSFLLRKIVFLKRKKTGKKKEIIMAWYNKTKTNKSDFGAICIFFSSKGNMIVLVKNIDLYFGILWLRLPCVSMNYILLSIWAIDQLSQK